MILWIIIIGIVIVVLVNLATEKKVDNYDVSKIDIHKLNIDVQNGVSEAERRRRCAAGYYDKETPLTVEDIEEAIKKAEK